MHACLQMDGLHFKKMDFSEFCAAAISVLQLEATERWEQHARAAYDIFEKEGNRVIYPDELAKVRPIIPLANNFWLVCSWVAFFLIHSEHSFPSVTMQVYDHLMIQFHYKSIFKFFSFFFLFFPLFFRRWD